MSPSTDVPSVMQDFFTRWEASGAAERANYSMFLNELCSLLEVPRPDTYDAREPRIPSPKSP